MLGSPSAGWVWKSYSLNSHSAILPSRSTLAFGFCDPTLLAFLRLLWPGYSLAGSVSSACPLNAVVLKAYSYVSSFFLLCIFFLDKDVNSWCQWSPNWTLDSHRVIFIPDSSHLQISHLTAHSTFYLEISKVTHNLQAQNWSCDLFPPKLVFPQGFLSWYHYPPTYSALQARKL